MTAAARLYASLLAAAVLCCAAKAPEPRLLWQMDVSAETGVHRTAERTRPLPIGGLRFSPDGHWIALTTWGDDRVHPSPDHRLILIPVTGRASESRTIPLPRGPVRLANAIHWSPNSEFAVIGLAGGFVAVVRIHDGRTCQAEAVINDVAGFAGPDFWVGTKTNPNVNPRAHGVQSSTVSVIRTDCTILAQWKFRGNARVAESSAFARVVAMWDTDDLIQLYEPVTGDFLGRILSPRSSDMIRFGESGKSICLGSILARGSLTCLEVRTGREIARHEKIHGGRPFDVSLLSSVTIATDGRFHDIPFTARITARSKSWVIWNYRSGRELLRMKVLRQTADVDPIFGERGGNPWAIGIAPDGKTFAIAGDGIVRLHEVPQTPGPSTR